MKAPSLAGDKPFVSVLTPTRNRRAFIPQLIRNFRLQSYPLDRMELIIADDGADPVSDLVADIRGVRYLRLEPVTLGAKRNILAGEARGEILVHMDDDDYYPRARVAHAVERLLHGRYPLAGSSEMYIYNLESKVLSCSGPFSPTHATNGTIAYRREYLNDNRFADDAVIQDEQLFTRGFTNPMIQLDPFKTILCIQHHINTWDKNMTLKRTVKYTLKDFVEDKDSLRFYRYQVYRRLEGAAE
ncbi:MAG: glycosyltransferase family 2 protein [Gammaproteobacteria bacterium]|nr:glycosyltransferase family 2 protein [Gammaproteobacteria bacterium]